ncbi:Asp23/Gls24 family envelope stress response protein [Sutcliffiella horikoshii]|uniref:Asp23/Gls24 family envelope stress response protein n=1 Tax=Sutcliffiella horikoshii TaxID=79883 RepID=UPI001F202B0D|nr:Asp23/Gls24 family envelope stress response protein [Sutcliffiella horikoshii]MCG1020513.1 Asp23/Gls24 family envelope stress response protein [Sutcliffiella horikoshii]
MLELKKSQTDMSNMLLQTVISICVTDIGGIKSLPPRLLGKFYSILSKDQLNNAVIQYDMDNNIIIDIFIEVEYNQRIPMKVQELQQLIKKEIEVITGYTVKEVNVYVDGIWVK